ncbi:MAG: class I SAM-dependent methyltransferase [Candidatus Limnocylindrales bacterium]
MTEQTDETPQTWHYGLMSRWWAEFNVAEPGELRLFGDAVRTYGEPALDLGCGAGRILLPLLAQGLDVDGVDMSPDMLARARELAGGVGLVPRLFNQTMHGLELDRRYGTIYICDSFGLGGFRDQDRLALGRVHDHLLPGGALVFNHYLPYDDVTEADWASWLPEHRADYPRPWPGEGTRRPLADGDELELLMHAVDFDPLLQRKTLEMRIRQWHGDTVVADETHLLHENVYFAQELLSMLSESGFADMRMLGRASGTSATPADTHIVFIARRASV